MSSAERSIPPPWARRPTDPADPGRGFWLGVAALVGLAAVLVAIAFAWGWLKVPGPVPPFLFLWPFGFVLVFALVFIVLRFAAGGARHYCWGSWAEPVDAREVVRMRYARGEIDRDQLDRMLRVLHEVD